MSDSEKTSVSVDLAKTTTQPISYCLENLPNQPAGVHLDAMLRNLMNTPSLFPATATLMAGAATLDLTPQSSVFLFGYPHVPRLSTGVHDGLESAALYLRHDGQQTIVIANDLIFVGKRLCAEVRRRISIKTGVPIEGIAITATHTHSGPVTVDCLSNRADPVVPKADAAYLEYVADVMVEAGCAAVRSARPAEAGLAIARAEGVGTNRHDPSGPSDPAVPVLVVRSVADRQPIACLLVHAMHTTVLHEDSTLISADFPFFTRQFLRRSGALPNHCPILYLNGASGNQSPRHVTRENTFAEAKRLGEMLGAVVAGVIKQIDFESASPLRARRTTVPLEIRQFPRVEEAVTRAGRAREEFDALRTAGASRTAVRTAECNWFGAEETVALARAGANGDITEAVESCTPAEVQVIRLGRWYFVFWPGEFFVEYALAVKAQSPDAFIVTMANGELQGYIVTPAAAAQGVYESTNALFSPDNGPRFVSATLGLLAEMV